MCLHVGERVLAFGRYRCCHHCALSSGRIRHTLADFCSIKYWPGNPTHRLALHSKPMKQDLQEKFILVLAEDPGGCLYGSSGKSSQMGVLVQKCVRSSAESHPYAVHAEGRTHGGGGRDHITSATTYSPI